jgi:hypothetical protein
MGENKTEDPDGCCFGRDKDRTNEDPKHEYNRKLPSYCDILTFASKIVPVLSVFESNLSLHELFWPFRISLI